MKLVNLKVQVHCLKPSWVEGENNAYRLYLNNDLLTERSWVWNIKTFIDETVWVELNSETDHLIKIVPILYPVNSLAKFAIANLRINEDSYSNGIQEQLELSFRIK